MTKENLTSGISILIPVYEFDVRKLVKELSLQLVKSGLNYEIRIYDDKSSDEIRSVNQEISSLPNCVVKELSDNLGRSKIRNLLAEDAKFERILFLDCDVALPCDKYIAKWIPCIDSSTTYVGGIIYTKEKPFIKSFYLHWLIGSKREVLGSEKRNTNPYGSFALINMMITKSIFLSIKLNENIKAYGHEDTVFGEALSKANHPVVHIDNTVCHIGLNEAEVYLNKTRIGVETLAKIVQRGEGGTSTKIVQTYQILAKCKLTYFYEIFYGFIQNAIYKNLVSKRPIPFLFDLYKLYYFVKGMKTHSKT